MYTIQILFDFLDLSQIGNVKIEMKHLSLDILTKTDFGCLEFSDGDASGWFIFFGKLAGQTYHLPYDYRTLISPGNYSKYQIGNGVGDYIFLTNDNYSQNLELLIVESGENDLKFYYSNDESTDFRNLLVKLDPKLAIQEYGDRLKSNGLSVTQFDNLKSVISILDQEYFFGNYEGY